MRYDIFVMFCVVQSIDIIVRQLHRLQCIFVFAIKIMLPLLFNIISRRVLVSFERVKE